MTPQRISFDYVAVPQLHTGLFGRVAAAFKRWREQLAQREALAQLNARMLQDIGITPSDVWRETRRSSWFV
jgi:uncharacterized protein YjiS (DUF1127 family)